MSRIRILVVDDHPIFLDGLCGALRLRSPDIEIVGTASNGREAVDLHQQLHPDVVLLDIRMPVLDGVEAARLIHRHDPATNIIMLTTFDDGDLVRGALQAGAKGYVLKDIPIAQLVHAIEIVQEGQVLVSPQAAESLSGAGEPAEGRRAGGVDRRGPARAQMDLEQTVPAYRRLTPRERDILYLMARGKNNQRIAEELHLSEKTVRNYATRIYDTLGVRNRAETVLWAVEHGII